MITTLMKMMSTMTLATVINASDEDADDDGGDDASAGDDEITVR